MNENVPGKVRRELRLVSLGLVALFGAFLLMFASALMGSTTVAASTRTNVPKYGMSFDLPKDWTEVSLTPGDVGGLLGNASNVNADLKSFLTTQAAAAAKKGLKFFAVNPGGSANVNIGIYGGTESLAALDATAKLGVSSIGATQVQTKQVHFKFGGAVEVTYTLPVSGSTTPVHGTQFYTSHKDKTYITTFSSQDGAVEAAAASTMMPTWRFSP
jgi:hypothetical protein